MFTVLWVNERGADRWERCDTRKEVAKLLDKENIWDSDTLIFPHTAEEFCIDGATFGGMT